LEQSSLVYFGGKIIVFMSGLVGFFGDGVYLFWLELFDKGADYGVF